MTSGTVPMGAVMIAQAHLRRLRERCREPERTIELFHGYTYSAHPLACAAALATLDTYKRPGPLRAVGRAGTLLGGAAPRPQGRRHVIDIRNIGLMGGGRDEPRPGKVGERAYDAMLMAYEKGMMIRITGDTIAMSPPLIVTRAQIDEMVDTIGQVLDEVS